MFPRPPTSAGRRGRADPHAPHSAPGTTHVPRRIARKSRPCVRSRRAKDPYARPELRRRRPRPVAGKAGPDTGPARDRQVPDRRFAGRAGRRGGVDRAEAPVPVLCHRDGPVMAADGSRPERGSAILSDIPLNAPGPFAPPCSDRDEDPTPRPPGDLCPGDGCPRADEGREPGASFSAAAPASRIDHIRRHEVDPRRAGCPRASDRRGGPFRPQGGHADPGGQRLGRRDLETEAARPRRGWPWSPVSCEVRHDTTGLRTPVPSARLQRRSWRCRPRPSPNRRRRRARPACAARTTPKAAPCAGAAASSCRQSAARTVGWGEA